MSSQIHVSVAFSSEKESTVSTGWASEPAWMRWRRKKFLHCPYRESSPSHAARSLVTVCMVGT